jgi:hypothetical protein
VTERRPLEVRRPLPGLRAFVAIVVAVASGGGCGLPVDPASQTPLNECEDDADCSDSAKCSTTNQGLMCVATETELGPIVIEVLPTSSSGQRALFEGVLSLEGRAALGSVSSIDLVLPTPVPVRGVVPSMAPAGCAAADGAEPATIALRRTSPLPSLDAEIIVTTEPVPASDGTTASHRFEVDVLPGTYDVTVTPTASAEGCPPSPPRLLVGLEVPANAPEVLLEFDAIEPLRLAGALRTPASVSLEGWTLELVEPSLGKTVSDRALLGASDDGVTRIVGVDGSDEGLRYTYAPGLLLRLSNVEGNLSVHWSLEALDLDGDGEVVIDLEDLVSTPSELEATVLAADGSLLAAARVLLQSLELNGDVSQNSGYRRIVDTDDQGRIRVGLVPGTYAVTVVPPSTEMGVYFGTWTVDATSGGNGVGFQLPAQPSLVGALETPAAEPLALAGIVAEPSDSRVRAYLDEVLREPTLEPRAASTNADAEGRYELRVDPGRFDLSLRPSAPRGFPWAVLPSVLVEPAEQQSTLDVGALSVPYPAIVQGTVRSSAAVEPLALVRAWASVATDDDSVPRYVAIGEATTDGAGRFLLALPPSLTPAR